MEEDLVCLTCRENNINKPLKTIGSLASHLRHAKGEDNHPIDMKEYYDRYLKKDGEGICQNPTCPNGHPKTSYQSITKGYSVGCCNSCSQQVPSVREKTENTCIEKYGCSHHLQSEEVINKRYDTLEERYGGRNPMQIDVFKNRSIETRMEKSDEITENRIKTVRKKYNVDNVMQCGEIADKLSKRNINEFKDEIMTRLEYMGLEIIEYTKCSSKCKLKCVFCGHIFEANPNHLFDSRRLNYCPNCITKKYGLQQSQVRDFCKEYFDNIIENDRKILDGKEIDILIPEINLGIEYGGFYWHSEVTGNTPRGYHRDKTINAFKKGIKLIHIFEDEWLYKRDIVKSILLNKFGKIEKSMGARNCTLDSISNAMAKEFYDNNHLQGNCNGIHYGLLYDNQLISCITFGKLRNPERSKNIEDGDYEIFRFCNRTFHNVNGSFSKLLNHFVKNHNPKSIITYADLRYSNGNVYGQCGFEFKRTSQPNYFYINRGKREHREKYQKHKLSQLLEVFNPNLSEWENMKNNGYDRVFDCGNNVFEWPKKSLIQTI